jgi:hypothetical protein
MSRRPPIVCQMRRHRPYRNEQAFGVPSVQTRTISAVNRSCASRAFVLPTMATPTSCPSRVTAPMAKRCATTGPAWRCSRPTKALASSRVSGITSVASPCRPRACDHSSWTPRASILSLAPARNGLGARRGSGSTQTHRRGNPTPRPSTRTSSGTSRRKRPRATSTRSPVGDHSSWSTATAGFGSEQSSPCGGSRRPWSTITSRSAPHACVSRTQTFTVTGYGGSATGLCAPADTGVECERVIRSCARNGTTTEIRLRNDPFDLIYPPLPVELVAA